MELDPNTESKFKLVFEGTSTEDPERLRSLKLLMISDLCLSVDQVREIFENTPATIQTAESEEQLSQIQEKLGEAGAKVLIVKPEDNEDSEEEDGDGIFEFEIDIDAVDGQEELKTRSEAAPRVYSLDEFGEDETDPEIASLLAGLEENSQFPQGESPDSEQSELEDEVDDLLAGLSQKTNLTNQPEDNSKLESIPLENWETALSSIDSETSHPIENESLSIAPEETESSLSNGSDPSLDTGDWSLSMEPEDSQKPEAIEESAEPLFSTKDSDRELGSAEEVEPFSPQDSSSEADELDIAPVEEDETPPRTEIDLADQIESVLEGLEEVALDEDTEFLPSLDQGNPPEEVSLPEETEDQKESETDPESKLAYELKKEIKEDTPSSTHQETRNENTSVDSSPPLSTRTNESQSEAYRNALKVSTKAERKTKKAKKTPRKKLKKLLIPIEVIVCIIFGVVILAIGNFALLSSPTQGAKPDISLQPPIHRAQTVRAASQPVSEKTHVMILREEKDISQLHVVCEFSANATTLHSLAVSLSALESPTQNAPAIRIEKIQASTFDITIEKSHDFEAVGEGSVFLIEGEDQIRTKAKVEVSGLYDPLQKEVIGKITITRSDGEKLASDAVQKTESGEYLIHISFPFKAKKVSDTP